MKELYKIIKKKYKDLEKNSSNISKTFIILYNFIRYIILYNFIRYIILYKTMLEFIFNKFSGLFKNIIC